MAQIRITSTSQHVGFRGTEPINNQDWRFKMVVGREERELSIKLLRQGSRMKELEAGSVAEFLGYFDFETRDRKLQLNYREEFQGAGKR